MRWISHPLIRPSLSTTANEWTPARLVMKPRAEETASGPGNPNGAKPTRWKYVALKKRFVRWRRWKSSCGHDVRALGGPIALRSGGLKHASTRKRPASTLNCAPILVTPPRPCFVRVRRINLKSGDVPSARNQ